jgi:hypothetical protein
MEGAIGTSVPVPSGMVFGQLGFARVLNPSFVVAHVFRHSRVLDSRRRFRRAGEAFARDCGAFAFGGLTPHRPTDRLYYVCRVVLFLRSFGLLPRVCCKLQI